MEWRDLLKWQVLPYIGYKCNLGGFLHSADAQGLNDIPEGWFCLPTQVVFVTLSWYVPCIGQYRSTKQVVFGTWRAATSRENNGVIATGNHFILIRCAEHHPYTHVGEWFHLSTRVVFATSPERHTGRSLRISSRDENEYITEIFFYIR